MPVVVAPLIGFSLGVLFAWAARAELSRTGTGATSRALVVVSLFGLLVYAPACGYLSANFPDWSFAYLFDAEKRSPASDMAIVLVDAVSAPLGFLLLARAAATGRTAALARAAAIPALFGSLFSLALLGRLRVYATYAQFHGDFGTSPTTGSPLGWALLWMGAVAVGGALWTLHVLRRFSEAD